MVGLYGSSKQLVEKLQSAFGLMFATIQRRKRYEALIRIVLGHTEILLQWANLGTKSG